MSNEPNKPIPAQELTEKELESITGGGKAEKIIICKAGSHVSPVLAELSCFLPGQTDELIHVHMNGEMQS